MDFSQLLHSGFQFLNLDDACEAEVDILQDMLFKQQDATQLSKLFHLKTFPDGGESHYGQYFIEDGTAGEGGLCDVAEGHEEQGQQGPITEQLQETPVVGTDVAIPVANGPLIPISPQHHDCAASGDINPPIVPTMPPPIRGYYSQQHVPVVHGSPQAQVGSPGMGQPQHGQVGVPGYSHVQVPISMHQQQLIMMPAQHQAGQPYVGMPPPSVHFVPPQRHHGHPSHNYVQGGPNKYSNGPRKSHTNRPRRNDPDMMNNYQAYYQGMYPTGMVQGIHHGYNLQQQFAHTVTGSPIIMQPASHHSKGPPMYAAPHQYSSPPPAAVPAPPHTSPLEAQHSPIPPGSENVVAAGSQQQQLPQNQMGHPQLPANTPPVSQPMMEEKQGSEYESESGLPNSSAVQIGLGQDGPSSVENKPKNINEAGQLPGRHEPQQGVADSRSYAPEAAHQSSASVGVRVAESASGGASAAAAGNVTSKKVPFTTQTQFSEIKTTNSPTPSQISNETVQVKGQSTTSPVPEKIQDNVVNNKCSSPTTKDNRPSQVSNSPAPAVSVQVQPTTTRTQTWAETSAAKPVRAPTSTLNNPSSNTNSSSGYVVSVAGGGEDKTLKEKQGQNKSSTEFPALGGKSAVNGSSTSSAVSSGVSGNPVVTSTPTPAAVPSQKSWASVVCKTKTSNSQNPTLTHTPAAANGTIGASGPQVSASISGGGVTPGAPQDAGSSSVPSTTPGSSAASSDRQIPIQMTPAGDNNGHVNVPIQSQSSDKSKPAVSSHPEPSVDFTSCSNDEIDPLAVRLGEFLANYQLNHQATALTPRGLTNQSNFCYINATLQALMACPPFVNLFRSMKEVGLAKTPCKATPIIQSVFDFVSEFEPLNRGNTSKRDRRNDSSFITGPNLEPSGIRKVLGLLGGSTFKVEGRQQDAEEFLSHLLNGLHDEMIKVIKLFENKSAGVGVTGGQPQANVLNGQHMEAGSEDDGDADNWLVKGPRNKGYVTRKTNIVKSPISEMLFGQLCSALQRTNDRNNVRNLQPFFTLQLDIQNDNIKSIRDALEGLSAKEEVSGLVSNNGQETTAWRQLSLEELPMILILHLKRFVYDKSGHKIQKLDKKLEFGIDLEIGKELLSANTRSKWSQKQRTYKLFAVVYHDGEEAYKGHYIADCFHPSGGNIWGQVGWLRYDDITVKPIADSAMLNSQPPRVPYLLYYRRADTLVSHHPQVPRNKDRPRNFASSSES